METQSMKLIDRLLANEVVPDAAIRLGARQLLTKKIAEETRPTPEAQQQALIDFIADLDQSPIAIKTDDANAQHYEVPTEFFTHVLGPRMKYSSGLWIEGCTTLAGAEEQMLALTCQRAQIEDGMEILELGCGWGSLTLWMAEKYPNARITAVSNSATQRTHILDACQKNGFRNVEILTANMIDFATDRTFDRVVSVEMFEHMKNYRKLLARVAGWMKPEALLFIHIFTHSKFAYHFEGTDPDDWITRYFFEGGTMPADQLLLYFQDDLRIRNHWHVSGSHYQRTAEAWLVNMGRNRSAITPILEQTYGAENVTRWRSYWRIFFIACAELWGYHRGNEWIVSHYLFKK